MSQLAAFFFSLLHDFISPFSIPTGPQEKGYVRTQVLFLNDTTHSLVTAENDKNSSTQTTWSSFPGSYSSHILPSGNFLSQWRE